MREQGAEISPSGAAGGAVEEGGEAINVAGQEADGWRRNLARNRGDKQRGGPGWSDCQLGALPDFLAGTSQDKRVWGAVRVLLFRGAYLTLPQLELPEKGPLACCKGRLILASGPVVME